MDTATVRTSLLKDARSIKRPALARQGAAVALGVTDARAGVGRESCPFSSVTEADLCANWRSGWDIVAETARKRITHAFLTMGD
jgi:hypothetical protein